MTQIKIPYNIPSLKAKEIIGDVLNSNEWKHLKTNARTEEEIKANFIVGKCTREIRTEWFTKQKYNFTNLPEKDRGADFILNGIPFDDKSLMGTYYPLNNNYNGLVIFKTNFDKDVPNLIYLGERLIFPYGAFKRLAEMIKNDPTNLDSMGKILQNSYLGVVGYKKRSDMVNDNGGYKKFVKQIPKGEDLNCGIGKPTWARGDCLVVWAKDMEDFYDLFPLPILQTPKVNPFKKYERV